MTERERIIEAGARALFERPRSDYSWDDALEQQRDAFRLEATAALDAMLPLILPEEPSANVRSAALQGFRNDMRWETDGEGGHSHVPNATAYTSAWKAAFAARRQELAK